MKCTVLNSNYPNLDPIVSKKKCVGLTFMLNGFVIDIYSYQVSAILTWKRFYTRYCHIFLLMCSVKYQSYILYFALVLLCLTLSKKIDLGSAHFLQQLKSSAEAWLIKYSKWQQQILFTLRSSKNLCTRKFLQDTLRFGYICLKASFFLNNNTQQKFTVVKTMCVGYNFITVGGLRSHIFTNEGLQFCKPD